MPDSVEGSLKSVLNEIHRLSSLPPIVGGAPASAEYSLEMIQNIISTWIPNGIGVPGPQGPAGASGPQGDPGAGVPNGGTTNQVLAKASDADQDTAWADQGGGSVPDPLTLVNGLLLGAGCC